MKISEQGLQILKDLEGFSRTIYDDGAGYPTIGYGHKLLESEKRHGVFLNGITEEQGEALLRQDVNFAERAVNDLVKVSLEQYQADALISFVYNIGQPNFSRSTLLRLLNQGRYHDVPAQLARWVFASGRMMGGLVKRRNVEGRVWNGVYPTGDLYA